MIRSDDPPDWRLALIAINLALPEILTAALRLLSGPVRSAGFLTCLCVLLILNARLLRFELARPWVVLCLMLSVVSGLVFGVLGWPRALPYMPLLLSFTPDP